MTLSPEFIEHVHYALKTWYPLDHEYHYSPYHPLGKMLGELGELLDDIVKLCYKPGYNSDLVSELGDVWYYLRILCYQQEYTPTTYPLPKKYPVEKLVTIAIKDVAIAYLNFLDFQGYPVFSLDVTYSVLVEILHRKDMILADLTKSNWDKIKPGAEKYKQWEKAFNTKGDN